MISDFSFSENTLGFLIEGDFDEEMGKNLNGQILERLKLSPKINLYLEDTNIEYFSLNAIVNEVVFKIKNREHFNKIALVSDRKWIQLCVKIEKVFSDVNVKSFSVDERMKAIRWISSTKY